MAAGLCGPSLLPAPMHPAPSLLPPWVTLARLPTPAFAPHASGLTPAGAPHPRPISAAQQLPQHLPSGCIQATRLLMFSQPVPCPTPVLRCRHPRLPELRELVPTQPMRPYPFQRRACRWLVQHSNGLHRRVSLQSAAAAPRPITLLRCTELLLCPRSLAVPQHCRHSLQTVELLCCYPTAPPTDSSCMRRLQPPRALGPSPGRPAWALEAMPQARRLPAVSQAFPTSQKDSAPPQDARGAVQVTSEAATGIGLVQHTPSRPVWLIPTTTSCQPPKPPDPETPNTAPSPLPCGSTAR